jgi:hypothetical protein
MRAIHVAFWFLREDAIGTNVLSCSQDSKIMGKKPMPTPSCRCVQQCLW